MNQIYAIRNEGVGYQFLDLTIMDVARNAPEDIPMDDILDFHLSNTSMATWWKAPETNFKSVEGEPASQIPDVSIWIDASLVLSPKAYRMLHEPLQSSGEFLPVIVEGQTYYIFNCLTLGDEDKGNCKFEYIDDMPMGLETLRFQESSSNLLIFKSTLQSCLTLFCGNKFKDVIESFELTGISFDENLIEIFE